ncbi:uncharacterized protein LOC119066967 [Bradysia coprophila]|uniref:uncharacterized protein LOC119066967 n=1 Tax=Bradysia coprophila TaxID=38358 RepID=UPI00187D980A|nr:uncharacterized protein LOC119066967 [Bradysia coprophila]
MTSKLSGTFLVLLAAFLMYADQASAVSSADIKKKITAQNANKYIGIGGRYGKLVDTVSKDKIIESDHFPPKSAYAYAKDKKIREIKERDMAAVSISYAEHRVLLTTGSGNEKGGFFNNWLADHFKKAEYYQAIEKNIQVYQQAGFLNQIKKGVLDALSVHEANGLITDAQRKALITEFKLDAYDKNFEKDKDRAEAVTVVHS